MPGRGWMLHLVASVGAIALATALLHELGVAAPTTVALTYLLVVLFAASFATLSVAVATALGATLALNFFFMPPVGTFTIADSHNWIALIAFLVVGVVASQLSSTARARTVEALERRNEVARLFDVSRDVLLTDDTEGAAEVVARHVARRFDLPVVLVALRTPGGEWRIVHGGREAPGVPNAALDVAWAHVRGDTMSAAGPPATPLPGAAVAAIRIGVQPVGLAVLGGRTLERGTAEAIAGLIAIALERARLLDERRELEWSRQRADLASSLLAALGHDLRTPLTAIRVAVTNAADATLPAEVRAGQSALAVSELDHLGRVLQEILDMARIEAHAVEAEPQWVTPGAIVDAAAAHVGSALSRHHLAVDADDTTHVRLDPGLTSAALAHVLENAAKYSPPGSTIRVAASCDTDGLQVTVTDEGPGLSADEIERLFEPFVRGTAGRHGAAGTGLGLSITRGLLAAEGGRISAEPSPDGARFRMAVPGPTRPVDAQEAWT